MGNLVAQQNPDNPRDRRPLAPIPSRESTVSYQVATLLAAANAFMMFLANTRDVSTEEPSVSKIDGGAKCAAETTLIGICDRLDKVIADDSRWSMALQDSLEDQLHQLYSAHTQSLVEQRHAMALSVAPQSRLSPQLLRLNNGAWAAFIGNPISNKDSVVGIGACVQDALDNFDLLVQGKSAPEMERLIKTYEKPKPVDGVTNFPIEKVSPDAQQTGDRGHVKAKRKIRGAKTRKAPRARKP